MRNKYCKLSRKILKFQRKNEEIKRVRPYLIPSAAGRWPVTGKFAKNGNKEGQTLFISVCGLGVTGSAWREFAKPDELLAVAQHQLFVSFGATNNANALDQFAKTPRRNAEIKRVRPYLFPQAL